MEWSEEYVWAYVEGELSAEEKSFVEAELLRDPQRAVEFQAMRDAMALLRGEAQAIAQHPPIEMPEELAAMFQGEVVPLKWHRPSFARGLRAAASEDRGAWFRADMAEGSAEIDVRVEGNTGGSPVLWITWTADFQPLEGWTLALKPDNEAGTKTFALPPLQRGEWSATRQDLGFDPQDVPFEIAWVQR